jgi:Helix-turn-helix domain
MNIRPRPGNSSAIWSFLQLRPASQPLKLPRVFACPRPSPAAFGTTEGQSSHAHPSAPGEGLRSRPCRAAGPQRQHRGPITRTFLEVLGVLLWGFHNSRTGCCFPSYETIATKAGCARSTVAEALKVLEWAGVLTWQNRITRIQVRERDLFGQWASRWRVIRTSNAYVFSDPQPQRVGIPASKSENPAGTQNQDVSNLLRLPASNPNSPVEQALQRLSANLEERLLLNRSDRRVGAT